MEKMLIFIFVLVTLNTTFSQNEKQYIELNKKYSYTRIFLKNNQIIVAKDMRLINDSSILFINMYSKGEEQKYVTDINFITTKKGNKVIAGTLIGAGIGLFSSVISVAIHNNSNVNSTAIITGFTIGSAAIGALIGICIPKWKKLYPPDYRNLNRNY